MGDQATLKDARITEEERRLKNSPKKQNFRSPEIYIVRQWEFIGKKAPVKCDATTFLSTDSEYEESILTSIKSLGFKKEAEACELKSSILAKSVKVAPRIDLIQCVPFIPSCATTPMHALWIEFCYWPRASTVNKRRNNATR